MEFIMMSHPDKGRSTSSSRQVHSHAARVAHARARRLRMAGYNTSRHADKPSRDASQPPDHVAVVSRRHRPRSMSERGKGSPISMMMPGSFEHEPLASFLKSLTPREHFMFNHYVEVLFPRMRVQCPVMNHLGERHSDIMDNWVLLCSTEIDMLNGCLLAASRHLSTEDPGKEYEAIAAQYKLKLVKNLRRTISTGNQSASAVTRALVLAFDEIMVGDMLMASKHLLGVVHIIQEAGGATAVGLSDLVRYIIYSCLHGKRLPDWEPALSHFSALFMEPASVCI